MKDRVALQKEYELADRAHREMVDVEVKEELEDASLVVGVVRIASAFTVVVIVLSSLILRMQSKSFIILSSYINRKYIDRAYNRRDIFA